MNDNKELISYNISVVFVLVFFFQAKVNNSSLVGVGYTQTLRPGKGYHVNYVTYVFCTSERKSLKSMHLYTTVSLIQNNFVLKAK